MATAMRPAADFPAYTRQVFIDTFLDAIQQHPAFRNRPMLYNIDMET